MSHPSASLAAASAIFSLALSGLALASAQGDSTPRSSATLAALSTSLDNPPNRFAYAPLAAELGKLIESAPALPGARILQVRTLIRAGDRSAARAELSALQPLAEDLPLIERQRVAIAAANLDGDPAREIELMQQLAKLQPGDRWIHYDIARAYGEIEDYPAVVRWVREALALAGPGDIWEGSWIHYLHSKALFRLGEFDAATTAAAAGRDEATTWRSTLYRMVLGQFGAGARAEAQTSLDEYLRYAREEGRTPEALIQFNIGVLFHELGDLATAERYLRAGLAMKPEDKYGTWALAYVLIDQPQGLAQGTQLLERALLAAPSDRNLLEARGWAAYRAGGYTDAQRWMQRARAAGGGWDQRLQDHATAVDAAASDASLPPAPRTPWL